MNEDDEFRIDNVREEGDDSLKQRAVERWLADGVIPAAEATKRADQLLLVATHGDEGVVAGMATTYLETASRLNLPLWHMRAYVAPEFRRHEIGFRMLIGAVNYHREQFASGRDTRGLGLYMEIENPYLKQHRNEALWPTSGLAFVGVNSRGDHCRVCYFENARLIATGDQ
ncbi:hypothetical protein [Wenzhouxiangella sp. EGI_FJ10305]|uniref:hypothetical protein n=1 Tax=Wenzhouxiangella sp. EGI_FJ10305 TaxID=3243768 RepID=UPI0035E20CA0